jgi:uncharacterized LabA/DUF88 family protein
MAFSIVIDGHNFINDLARYGKDNDYILKRLSFPILHDIIQEKLKSAGLYAYPFIHTEFVCSDRGPIGPFKPNEKNALISKLKNEMGVTVREVRQHTDGNDKQKGVDFTVFITMMRLGKPSSHIVLVASDADYCPAIRLMTEQGVHVVILGFKNKAPLLNEELINESYLFLDLGELLEDMERRLETADSERTESIDESKAKQ